IFAMINLQKGSLEKCLTLPAMLECLNCSQKEFSVLQLMTDFQLHSLGVELVKAFSVLGQEKPLFSPLFSAQNLQSKKTAETAEKQHPSQTISDITGILSSCRL
ncbi:MAG TPA: hypothetical protein VJ205_03500, partial [Gammaproteobacteria bacterium]|nr:hypothetical protein [Gammaproteobacteria bacterium]